MWPFKRKPQWTLLDAKMGPLKRLNEYTQLGHMLWYYIDYKTNQFLVSCSGGLTIKGRLDKDVQNNLVAAINKQISEIVIDTLNDEKVINV